MRLCPPPPLDFAFGSPLRTNTNGMFDWQAHLSVNHAAGVRGGAGVSRTALVAEERTRRERESILR